MSMSDDQFATKEEVHGLRQRLEEDHVLEDAQAASAHRARRQDPRLPRMHHPIRDVKHNHEPGCERRHRDL